MSRSRSAGLTIVTPWLDHPEFIEDYERAVKRSGADVIVIDNGSTPDNHARLYYMVQHVAGVLVTNRVNQWFSAAVNQGLDLARTEAIVVLNNDIIAEPHTWQQAAADLAREPDHLFGPSMGARVVDGVSLPYLEGWCLGAHADIWRDLGGFDEVAFPLPYWEDNDLCLRAVLAGYYLREANWDVQHKRNGTARGMSGATAGARANQTLFENRARDARTSLHLASAHG